MQLFRFMDPSRDPERRGVNICIITRNLGINWANCYSRESKFRGQLRWRTPSLHNFGNQWFCGIIAVLFREQSSSNKWGPESQWSPRKDSWRQFGFLLPRQLRSTQHGVRIEQISLLIGVNLGRLYHCLGHWVFWNLKLKLKDTGNWGK